MIIFKAKPTPAGKTCGHKNTVTYEIVNNVPDKWGNQYPPRNECYISVSETANSNGKLTIDFLDNVFYPEVGAEEGELDEPAGLLLDAF